jgi:hypothetical protein
VKRCNEITPSAGSCLRARALVNADRGRCDEMEDDARRLAVVEPSGHRTYELLAQAMAARRAPVERIRDVLAKRTALEPDGRSRRRAEIQAMLWTATLVGDLAAAEKAALAWDDLYADSVVADDHDGPTMYLLDVLDETGEVSNALEVTDAYDRRSSGWTGKSPTIRTRLAYLRRHAKRIDEATFQRTREEVLRSIAASSGANWAWATVCAESSRTPAEGIEALAARPDAGPSARPDGDSHLNALFEAAWIGHTYLLAGQPEMALPSLRRGAASCAILPNAATHRAYPVWWMRAHEMLGEALEQTGDKGGACEAYGVVLDRWKNPKPRSVTVEKAKERVKVLACPSSR